MNKVDTQFLLLQLEQVSVWERAKAESATYYPPTYDSDGFIHATHEANLLLDVLNHFYREVKDSFLCLVLDTESLTSPVKMEAPAPVGDKSAEGGPAPVSFPHIYGPINMNCVRQSCPVIRSDDGSFIRIEGL